MKQSTFRLLESACVTLAPVYLSAVYIATYGWTFLSSELLLTASAVLVREYIEDELCEVLEHFTSLDSVLKAIQRSTRNSNLATNLTTRDLGKAFLVCLLLVLNAVNPGPTAQHLLFRLFLVLVFAVKLDSEVALRRTVAYYHHCASDSSRPARAWLRELTAMWGCAVWLPASLRGEDLTPGGAAAAIDSASLENILLSSSAPGAASASKGGLAAATPAVVPAGPKRHSAPTLLAVLHFAAAETAVVVLCVAAPVLSAALDADGADGYGGRIYSPARCGLLVLGAAAQCAVLTFSAGYIQHRRAIALELRRPELSVDRHVGSAVGSSGISRCASSDGPAAADTSAAGPTLQAASTTGTLATRVVLRLLCAQIDCDAHTMCTASGGCLTRSPADLFASGMAQNSTGAHGGSSGDAFSAGAGEASRSAGSSGRAAGGAGAATGKGRIPSAGVGAGAAGAGAGDSGKGRRGTPGSSLSKPAPSAPPPPAQVQGSATDGNCAEAAAVRGGAQSYMLNLSLLTMLAAAALQLLLMLGRLLDKRSATGAVLAGGGSLTVAVWLRAALPGALLGLPGGAAGGSRSE